MPPEAEAAVAPAALDGFDFEAERGRLKGLAYRLLGSLMDAEDVVQDAWLRWQNAAAAATVVETPRAYLSSIVTRLCLDRLKQARRRREVYVGPWLPEPVLEDPALHALPAERLAGEVTFALMLALERLSPLERAAFILHDVFDVPFDEVARTLGRSEDTCRQLARRARAHVAAERPRYAVPDATGEAVAEAFFSAARSGDTAALARLLAAEATLHTDGGGRKVAALNIIRGGAKVLRFFAGIARKPTSAPPREERACRLNGLPARLTVEADGTRQATAVEVVDGRVTAVYIVRNPDKLARLWEA